MVGTSAVAGSGSVIMIYGLTPGRTNCDHVFNLLCSYGNVLKVFLVLFKFNTFGRVFIQFNDELLAQIFWRANFGGIFMMIYFVRTFLAGYFLEGDFGGEKSFKFWRAIFGGII